MRYCLSVIGRCILFATMVLITPVLSEASPALVFDHTTHEFGTIIAGDKVKHDFPFKNISKKNVTIRNIHTSCGCTAAKIGKSTVPGGETGLIHVTFNSRGKRGKITKRITITTDEDSAGPYTLMIFTRVNAKPRTFSTHPVPRKNQTIFTPPCRACHVTAGENKVGRALYAADCAMCHGSASHFVIDGAPALTGSTFLSNVSDTNLEKKIANGTSNPMMPGFGQDHGGPLTPGAIRSLVQYFHSIRKKLPVDTPPARPEDFNGRMTPR